MRKWTAFEIIGHNNEQPGIVWTRTGIAKLGEPPIVRKIEYYQTETERDAQIFKSPNFAK